MKYTQEYEILIIKLYSVYQLPIYFCYECESKSKKSKKINLYYSKYYPQKVKYY